MPTVSASRLDLLLDNETKLLGFAASVLQISEYELFRIAHRAWHDQEVTETRLDALFKNYLTTGDAPFWVHDFARKVHDKFRAGTLNYKDYGIRRRVIDRRTRIMGWIIVGCLLIMLILYSYLLANYTPDRLF